MKRTAAILTGACALMLVTPAIAHATENPGTKTISWFMEGSVHGETTWPQPVYTDQCGWLQVDTYKYATDTERATVDALDDDGYLRLVNGSPEDSSVYLSHYYKEVPCSTASPTPTETPTPTSTPTPTETPTPTPTPSDVPTVAPVLIGTPSPSTSLTDTPVVSSESPTSVETSLPSSPTSPPSQSTGPGLAETGMNTVQALSLIGSIILIGYVLFMVASKRRQENDTE